MKQEVTQCGMCKHYSEEQYCEIWQQYITNDAFYCACGAKADRKTENNSEKPNNCEDEPQTEYPTEWCEKCELWREDNCMGVAQCKRNIQVLTEAYKQDEPQTERSENDR